MLIDIRVFFFFKQKTAYEMRISDWSSDVCSSDLGSALHMEHLFRVRADTAEQTEAGLDKKWPLDETLLPEIVQIMEVARVVAFELVARPRFVQRLERAADVLEAVAEDEVVAPLEHRRLPQIGRAHV